MKQSFPTCISINMERVTKKANSSVAFCSNCPRNHFGICPSIVKILSQESEFHSPEQLPLPAKQYLYHQGEQRHGLYILQEGWVLLTTMTKQGKRQIIRSVLPGDILGFQPDLHGPALYSAIALLDSIVCTVPDLVKMFTAHPEFVPKLIWAEACETTLTERYMTNIAHRDAREKIAFMTLELYQRLKFRGLNNGYIVPFPLSQEDIADTLGLTTIHVNRTLHKLQQENLISLHKHELTILDYEKLHALVGTELIPLDTCDIFIDA